ncbi:MAG TPA: PQ-loop repeat-containing protein [Acidimicrobiales bacterium]
MVPVSEVAGFAGVGLAGGAYVPQITHLIRAHCSAGISRIAFAVWFVSSLLVATRAVAVRDGVFIVLGVVQVVATILICIFAAIYKDSYCEIHLPRRLASLTGLPGEQV